MQITAWIKQNKLASLLLIIIGLYILRNIFDGMSGILPTRMYQKSSSYEMGAPAADSGSIANILPRLGGGADYLPNNPAPPSSGRQKPDGGTKLLPFSCRQKRI